MTAPLFRSHLTMHATRAVPYVCRSSEFWCLTQPHFQLQAEVDLVPANREGIGPVNHTASFHLARSPPNYCSSVTYRRFTYQSFDGLIDSKLDMFCIGSISISVLIHTTPLHTFYFFAWCCAFWLRSTWFQLYEKRRGDIPAGFVIPIQQRLKAGPLLHVPITSAAFETGVFSSGWCLFSCRGD